MPFGVWQMTLSAVRHFVFRSGGDITIKYRLRVLPTETEEQEEEEGGEATTTTMAEGVPAAPLTSG